jgi:S-adenosylmethionine:tRNA ribosyltransferase-isomerase
MSRMKLDDFDFDLPERLIATRPARPRSSARLLLAEGDGIADRHVFDLPDILWPGDRLVLNDTRVIPARLFGTRTRGDAVAKIEVTLMEPEAGGTWAAMAKPLRKLAAGDRLAFDAGLGAAVADKADDRVSLRFDLEGDAFQEALNRAGAMPLPPYIAGKRAADEQDKDDYQTVWAKRPGAVAAPTASLHFDAPLLAALAARGIGMTHVTLHVGAGTFLPVKVEDVTTHRMHAEWGQISAAAEDGSLAPWEGETDIFIYPGFRFRVADALMTNFHLPKSTLMMLVSALMGKSRIDRIYAHAIAAEYRFFSYGDSSLLVPGGAAS